jgi:Raf kinase inhibitor-like YbhB/YbcL family protein
MKLTSPDFAPDARLDDRHAATDRNEPPRLVVDDLPEGTVELALIVHDPDAPMPHGFTHLLRYGLPAADGEIDVTRGAGRDGTNDFGKLGYGGPMPPIGHGLHHYYFWVYALDRPVAGTPSRLEFLADCASAILAQQRVVGVYSRDDE